MRLPSKLWSKGCLAKALYREVVSLEELRTLLSGFASVINNCPLTYITEDTAECLTPNHLLYGRTILLSPPFEYLCWRFPLCWKSSANRRHRPLCTWVVLQIKRNLKSKIFLLELWFESLTIELYNGVKLNEFYSSSKVE